MDATVYDKCLGVENAVKKSLDIDKNEFYKIACKLSTWHYPSKRWKTMTLSKVEATVYEWMLNNNYNPSTVYKWKLALGTNKDVLQKLKTGKIGLNRAIATKNAGLSEVETRFMYHVKQSISKYVIR